MGRLLVVVERRLSSIALTQADALAQADDEPQLVHVDMVAPDLADFLRSDAAAGRKSL